MSVSWYWLTDEKKITIFELSGQWTWAEYLAVWNAGLDSLVELDHTAHAIIIFAPDVSSSYVPPYAISTILKLVRRQVPNAGMVIIVNVDNWSLQALVQALGWLSPRFRDSVRLTTTVEQALEHIAAAAPDTRP